MKKNMSILCLFIACAFILTIPAVADSIWRVDFSNNAPPAGVSVITKYCWDVENHLEFYSPDSVLVVFFNLPDKNKGSYLLKITDCGTLIPITTTEPYAGGMKSPVTISVNDITAVEGIDVNWVDDKTNSYKIGKFLNSGKNRITITLGMLANTRYRLRQLELIRK